MAVLDSEPRSASVTAVEDAVVLKIGRDDFRDILGERPEIAMGVIKALTRRLRETSRTSCPSAPGSVHLGRQEGFGISRVAHLPRRDPAAAVDDRQGRKPRLLPEVLAR